MIDCDLYDSTISVLDFIKDYLQDGTIIIFDEYYFGSEKKAFEEWLEKNPDVSATQYHKYDVLGNSFIINKKQKVK